MPRPMLTLSPKLSQRLKVVLSQRLKVALSQRPTPEPRSPLVLTLKLKPTPLLMQMPKLKVSGAGSLIAVEDAILVQLQRLD